LFWGDCQDLFSVFKYFFQFVFIVKEAILIQFTEEKRFWLISVTDLIVKRRQDFVNACEQVNGNFNSLIWHGGERVTEKTNQRKYFL